MTNSLDRKPNSALSQWRSQKVDDPAWLWWLVAGSSIGAHLLLLNLALPFSSSLSTQSSSSNPIAIDLIELPPTEPPATSPPPPQNPITAVPPAAPAPLPPTPAPSTPTAGDIALAPAPAPLPSPISPDPLPPRAPASQPPISSQITSTPTQTQTTPITPPIVPNTASSDNFNPASTPNSASATEPSPTQTPATQTSPPSDSESSTSTSSTPVSPGSSIVTERITVDVPDVSGRMDVSPASTAPLGQIETPQQIIPVRLTASLTTAEPDPAATIEAETIAQPLQETETFTADPARSPCLITPDVIPYLSKTVAVQVTTNETGQATDASVRQSSGSPVYDNLAVCMVRQWQFQPATAQGIPVVSDALVVAVRIE